MGLHFHDVVSIKQPIHLLTGHDDQFIGAFWPFEFFFRETFVIKHEAIVFPKQALDFITLTIGEGIEVASKGIVVKFQLDNCR